MNSAIIIMTLLGCGQTEAACDYIRTVETQFASRAECEARMDSELLRTGSADYPSVIAICEPPRELQAQIDDLPGPGAADDQMAHAPEVIMAPAEAEPRPLERLALKSRKIAHRIGAKLRSAWHKMVKPGSGGDEPTRLGEARISDG